MTLPSSNYVASSFQSSIYGMESTSFCRESVVDASQEECHLKDRQLTDD